MNLSHVIDHFIFPRETILAFPVASRNLAIDHVDNLTAVRVGDVALHVCFARADVTAVWEETGHFGAGDKRSDQVIKKEFPWKSRLTVKQSEKW